MPAKREYVISTLIRSVGYSEPEKLLEIEFATNGTVYQYFDVPFREYWGLLNARSHGEYFWGNIRDVYAYSLVGSGYTTEFI